MGNCYQERMSAAHGLLILLKLGTGTGFVCNSASRAQLRGLARETTVAIPLKGIMCRENSEVGW